MTERQLPTIARLRQIPTESIKGRRLLLYGLPTSGRVVIGREADCHLRLNSTLYHTVSRHHVELRSRPSSPQTLGQGNVWQVQDLNTANGTYVNGERLTGWHQLQDGDQIRLSVSGPEFVFEQVAAAQSTDPQAQPVRRSSPQKPIGDPASARASNSQPVTLTQLVPLLSTARDLPNKAYLLPGVITVLFVVLMFATVNQSTLFKQLLATYVTAVAYYFIYQLCGKRKAWWMPISMAITTILILASPLLGVFTTLFRDILPGNLPNSAQTLGFPLLLLRMFFGAGLMEELLKALPLGLAFFLGTRLRSPWRETIGIWEPLDGILLGTASAAGFILYETIGQYVPLIVQQGGELQGLQVLIPRVLGSVAGHMAYSGYFGYFIGLSVLRPGQRWSILAVGYLSAAMLHALWNATGFFHPLLLAIVGILSYTCLSAAILKARVISPTRQKNFATRLWPPNDTPDDTD